jgi:hypothetical protein
MNIPAPTDNNQGAAPVPAIQEVAGASGNTSGTQALSPVSTQVTANIAPSPHEKDPMAFVQDDARAEAGYNKQNIGKAEQALGIDPSGGWDSASKVAGGVADAASKASDTLYGAPGKILTGVANAGEQAEGMRPPTQPFKNQSDVAASVANDVKGAMPDIKKVSASEGAAALGMDPTGGAGKLADAASSAGDMLARGVHAIPEALRSVPGRIGGALTGLANAGEQAEGMRPPTQPYKNLGEVVDARTEAAGDTLSKAKGVASSAIDSVMGARDKAAGVLSDAALAATPTASKVVDSLSNAAEGVRGIFKGSPGAQAATTQAQPSGINLDYKKDTPLLSDFGQGKVDLANSSDAAPAEKPAPAAEKPTARQSTARGDEPKGVAKMRSFKPASGEAGRNSLMNPNEHFGENESRGIYRTVPSSSGQPGVRTDTFGKDVVADPKGAGTDQYGRRTSGYLDSQGRPLLAAPGDDDIPLTNEQRVKLYGRSPEQIAQDRYMTTPNNYGTTDSSQHAIHSDALDARDFNASIDDGRTSPERAKALSKAWAKADNAANHTPAMTDENMADYNPAFINAAANYKKTQSDISRAGEISPASQADIDYKRAKTEALKNGGKEGKTTYRPNDEGELVPVSGREAEELHTQQQKTKRYVSDADLAESVIANEDGRSSEANIAKMKEWLKSSNGQRALSERAKYNAERGIR